ncbi:SpoIIE family protein phosphatase [Streptomyces sp. NPDC041068]|uniref:PP2C family protein-serine/threonine phosphatase n=1 Tax=Streptomyces sp. NPDC041068 TaxID=3155130 RepID=UPI00340BB623
MSQLPVPRAVHAVRAAVVLGIALVMALDIALRATHPGVVAALAGVAALPLFLPSPRRRSLVTGAATFGATLLLGMGHWRDRPIVIGATLINIVLITALARYLGRPSAPCPAEAAEPDHLRNASSWIGNVRVEMRALPADSTGRMTADFCDLRPTPFGVRLLVVDFMGKGTETQEKAASLLYRWARVAGETPGLAESARRLDSLLAEEDLFAKALLIGVADDGTTTLICCGHPPPLVVADGSAHPLSLVSLLPPLGLFDLVDHDIPIYATTVRLTPGRRLLLHTDGASDTPDAKGALYPLASRAGALDALDPGVCLDRMAGELREHIGASARDEALLLLIECAPQAAASVAPGSPAGTSGGDIADAAA